MVPSAEFNFDELLSQIGSFGPFQIRVFILVSAFEAPAAWMLLQHVFAAARPSWVCPSADRGGNSTSAGGAWTMSMPAENSTGCTPYGSVCPGRVYTSDYTSIVTEWDLVCDRDYIRTWIMTSQMAGVLVGAFVTGQLADTLGRRKVFFMVYTLLLVSGFISSFANSWQLYAAIKFLVGAFFGGTLLVNFVLPLEFVGRRWRTFCGCIGFWACGVMSLALLAYLIRDWRHLSMATSAGGVLLIFTWWFVPESPRWLVQQGRHEEAIRILTHIAEFNKKPTPDFSKLTASSSSEESLPKQEKRYSYYDLFRNCSMSKNTLILLYIWFVCSSVYYGSSLNVGSLSGDKYLNFFFSGLVEIPPLILVVLINNRIGRRKTLFFLLSIAGIAMLAILFVHLAGRLNDLPALTVTLFMVGRAGIAGSWAAAQIFSAEVFPTVVRNIGVGACSMSSRIGGIVAPHMVSLDKVSQPLPFIVFGSLAILGSLLTLLLPETLNLPLPDKLPARQWCSRQKSELEMVSVSGNVANGHGRASEKGHYKGSESETMPTGRGMEKNPYECVPTEEVNVLLV